MAYRLNRSVESLIHYSSEIVLKVLAHNNFIGRIIGKGGNIINTLKKDTDTKYARNMSSINNDSCSFSVLLYRVFTI